jgi:hypothetical protein
VPTSFIFEMLTKLPLPKSVRSAKMLRGDIQYAATVRTSVFISTLTGSRAQS